MKLIWQIVGWIALGAFFLWCFSSWADQSFQDRFMGVAVGIGIMVFYFCNRVVEELKGLRRDMAALRNEMHNARSARLSSMFDED